QAGRRTPADRLAGQRIARHWMAGSSRAAAVQLDPWSSETKTSPSAVPKARVPFLATRHAVSMFPENKPGSPALRLSHGASASMSMVGSQDAPPSVDLGIPPTCTLTKIPL